MEKGSAASPDWRDIRLGTRVRIALWLRDSVGEGSTFTKEQIRSAIGESDQIDRRLRDLRPAGWVIRTFRDHAGLLPQELHLEQIGLPVWEAEHRGAGLRQISQRLRREVYERDGHRCRSCGVAAGEEYPDEAGSRARLTVGSVTLDGRGGGTSPEALVTRCARCGGAARHDPASETGAGRVWEAIEALPAKQRRELLAWMVYGARRPTPAEEAWGLYWQLPGTLREEVKRDLYDRLHG
ncbi:HNH endonuclease [Streptacidiphilus sp. N1-3]|uniref:HNH endonuclease n=1 Tax=Streptacidiphilus alkalitolerans TaxID=3342712 RepID=A0ABV6WVP6_9ACTN